MSIRGLSILLDTNTVKYKIDLCNKLTVISGDSGVGKTHFSNSIANIRNNGYKLYLEGEEELREAEIIVLNTNESYVLDGIKGSSKHYIFIIDDNEYILSSKFSNFFSRDTSNLFIIINRFEGLDISKVNQIPISVNGIYDLVQENGFQILKNRFNFSKSHIDSVDYVITEDSSLGYKFLKKYGEPVYSTKGKNNVTDYIKSHEQEFLGKSILVFVDFGSFGSEMQKLVYYSSRRDINILVPNMYICFEYLLLHSNFIRDIYSPTLSDLIKYKSEEAYYQDRLRKVTEGKEYYMSHDAKILRGCYFKDCCHRNTRCDKYMEGNKLRNMFLNTIWEDDFKAIQNSVLLSLT